MEYECLEVWLDELYNSANFPWQISINQNYSIQYMISSRRKYCRRILMCAPMWSISLAFLPLRLRICVIKIAAFKGGHNFGKGRKRRESLLSQVVSPLMCVTFSAFCCSHYALTQMRNKNSNIQGRSPNVAIWLSIPSETALKGKNSFYEL